MIHLHFGLHFGSGIYSGLEKDTGKETSYEAITTTFKKRKEVSLNEGRRREGGGSGDT